MTSIMVYFTKDLGKDTKLSVFTFATNDGPILAAVKIGELDLVVDIEHADRLRDLLIEAQRQIRVAERERDERNRQDERNMLISKGPIPVGAEQSPERALQQPDRASVALDKRGSSDDPFYELVDDDND